MPVSSINIALFYRLTRLDNGRSVIAKRDADPPLITGVGGRWDVVDRPRRTSFTTWNGDDPYRMDVPILFDGWNDQSSVENDVAILNHMQIAAGDYSPPPQVKIEGAVPVDGATWVLEPQISWGTNIIYHPDGYRLRQDAVVHLLQFIAPDSLSVKPPATAHTHIVKPGETLKDISRQEYGTPKYWSLLKKANGIRDIKKLPKNIQIPAIINP